MLLSIDSSPQSFKNSAQNCRRRSSWRACSRRTYVWLPFFSWRIQRMLLWLISISADKWRDDFCRLGYNFMVASSHLASFVVVFGGERREKDRIGRYFCLTLYMNSMDQLKLKKSNWKYVFEFIFVWSSQKWHNWSDCDWLCDSSIHQKTFLV